MPKLTLEGTVTAPDSDLVAMLEALPEHIAATRAEPGCLAFSPDTSPVRSISHVTC